jgi:uncharacterized protein
VPVRFLLLVLALSLPLWGLAQVVQAEPLPGLPVSALMTFAPALAALVLAFRTEGASGAKTLAARSADAPRLARHGAWWPLILLMPAVVFAPAIVRGELAPAAALWLPAVMLLAFFLAALGEELGWTGFLLERLERRLGETAAGLLIGAIWAAWHLVPFLQADRPLDWIAWQCAKSVAERVIMVRLYFGAGRSVFAVALFHAFSNVAAFALPLWGGVYDPRSTALILAGLALVLILARDRRGRPEQR